MRTAETRYTGNVTQRPKNSLELIKRVLGGNYLQLELRHLTIDEAPDEDCQVTIETVDTQGISQRVEGTGQGMVDALLKGLLVRYAREYHSLESIEMANFRVEAQQGTKQHKSGGDAMSTVTIVVKNSEGNRFEFVDESRSMVSSAARAALASVEYFVNAERAFITLYKSRQDAQERQRHDLVTRYTSEMAEVVKSTSYTEVIENIKREIGR